MKTANPFIGVILLIVVGSVASAVRGQNPTRARTETGREVLLYANGTWTYAEDIKTESSRSTMFKKPTAANKAFNSQKGAFRIWIDESRWKEARKSNDATEFQFTHVSGDVYAMAVTERLSMPLSSLKEIAVANAKNAAPDIRVVVDEERVVNGRKVLCLIMEGTIKGILFTYYGYYYSDKTGTIQLITYTGQNLFEEYKQELTSFLNGLEVYER